MRAWSLILILLLISGSLFADEQMAVRLNDQGILKILQMAVQYNSSFKEARSITIPENIYKFTIAKSTLRSNPIVSVLSKISDVSLSRDLDFFLNTSDMIVKGSVDERSIKTSISNSSEHGFDLKVSLNLPQVEVTGSRLSLCEDRQRNSKDCGSGLQVAVTNLSIKTINEPISLSLVLRLRTDGGVARISVISVESNLEGSDAPGLDINFSSLNVPRIALVVNDQETVLDTSNLRSQLIKRKTFLGRKLLSFVGDFIAGDLAEMLNVYLINKDVATSFQIYRRSQAATFNEFLKNPEIQPVSGGLSISRPISASANNPLFQMIGQISDLIRSAQVGVSLKEISTPGNRDVQLAGILNFMINGQDMKIKNTLGHSGRPLPALNLKPHRGHDINLAISEPLINGALDLANNNGIFNEMLESNGNVRGFSIRSVKMHFYQNRAIIAVVNAQIDLKQLESDGVSSWLKNRIATYIERNNYNSVIYFPIEVMMVPTLKTLRDGSVRLDLRVLSPFNYVNLPNRYNYPNNVPIMSETVRDGVMQKLKESLGGYMNQTYSVDLTKFLNQAGVVFKPKTILLDQSAYLLINLDIDEIKFNSKNPNLR